MQRVGKHFMEPKRRRYFVVISDRDSCISSTCKLQIKLQVEKKAAINYINNHTGKRPKPKRQKQQPSLRSWRPHKNSKLIAKMARRETKQFSLHTFMALAAKKAEAAPPRCSYRSFCLRSLTQVARTPNPRITL
jgi:hypothetical protein